MDRSQLIQEVQRIGNGVIGPRAAVAIRHVANQNGVSSMANFDEMAPNTTVSQTQEQPDFMSDSIGDKSYRCVFNSCSVGMAIATMGGSFIDCNPAFTKLSNYTKEELKVTTIFNLTSREDLQGAFDMMSQLITPMNFESASVTSLGSVAQPPVVLRSSIPHRTDLGLSVSLIRGDDGVARYFNVTLVKLPTPTAFGTGNGKPVPATVDMSTETTTVYARQPTDDQMMNKSVYQQDMNTPKYTSG
jgi:PAS domain-containing protein